MNGAAATGTMQLAVTAPVGPAVWLSGGAGRPRVAPETSRRCVSAACGMPRAGFLLLWLTRVTPPFSFSPLGGE